MMWDYRKDDEFYIHEKFGNVPKGWKVKPLSECFDFYPTASYSRSNLTETGDCCYVHYGDIHTKFQVFLDFNKEQLPFVSFDMARRFSKLEDGDLIMADASEDYDGVGKTVEVVNIEDNIAIAGLHTLHLRCKDDCYVKGFRGYVLNNEKVRISILRIATGIKVYSVTKTDLKKILLPQPPEPEQTAIATVLSKVDDAIAATENSIKAAEKLKKAMMQNLLTGKLKPDGTWRKEDEFYVDEKFGKVPVGWDILKIKKLIKLKNGKGNTTSNLKETPDDNYNVPVFGGNGITGYYHTPLLQSSTLIIGRVGEYCGNVFKTPDKCWVTDNAMLVDKFLIQDYSLDFMSFQLSRCNFKNYSDSTGQPKITQGGIGALHVIFPPSKKEQESIAERIKSMDSLIAWKTEKIKSLQRLKKSLSQNLLTGKVRLSTEVIDKILNKQKIEVIEDVAV